MTRIRPCIDLHEGKVKQIVGSSLRTTAPTEAEASAASASSSSASVNFSSDEPPSHFARMYRNDNLTGGHVIMLGRGESNERAARNALEGWPGGLQVGGGVTAENAREWLGESNKAGASHVIVTSYVFRNDTGKVDYDRLTKLVDAVGKDRLVLDLSCRRKKKEQEEVNEDGKDGGGADAEAPYYVVTNKWQTFTDTKVTPETLQHLSNYCCEFLVHAVDVEGKQSGIQRDLVEFLGRHSPVPVTYAGGVSSIADLDLVDELGNGKVDVTVGSALDIFGGRLPYREVVEWHRKRNPPP